MTVRSRCTAIKEDGSRCQQFTKSSAALCIWHDPARVEEAQLLRKRAGQRRKETRSRTVDASELPPMDTLEDLEAAAVWAARAVACGQLDDRTAGAFTRSIEATHRLKSARLGLEKRVKDLARQVAAQNGKDA